MKLIVSLLTPLLVGYLGSLITIREIPNWYAGLNKPSLVPPNGVFGPVWTTLYILMGIAFYLVWIKKKNNKKTAYFLFGLQLLLNFLWSQIFFGWHLLGLASLEIMVLLVVILLMILEFKKFSKYTPLLLAPYLLWVTFATYLTVSVWRLN